MPITKVENINKNSWWALWHITENLEDLLSITEENDIKTFYNENINHPQKQKEWLAARLVLKFLTERMGGEYSGCSKDEFGKPHLSKNTFFISITNSFPYAAGIICSSAPVGIDLEFPKQKLKYLAPKFLNKTELKSAGEDILKLCLYWCAKETLFKIHGKNKISFKENIFITPFNLDHTGNIQGTIAIKSKIYKYDICYKFLDSFLISYNINS